MIRTHRFDIRAPRRDRRRRAIAMALGVSIAVLCVTLAGAPARVAQIVPSVGLTRSAQGTETNSSVGLALRGGLAPPVIATEIGAAYRSDELHGGDVSVRMWPITASLLVSPIPTLYGRVGAGWYHTTYERETAPFTRDVTHEQFGTHVGGGMRVPLAKAAAVELDGRYVFLQDQENNELLPDGFDPSFWTLSLGLAIGF